MTRNESTADRVIRVVIGLALLAAAIFAPVPFGGQIALAALGGIALITGAAGFCPLYRVLGISTCRVPRAQQQT